MNKKVSIAFVALIAITMVAVGFAVVLNQKSFTNTATIGVIGQISLWQDSACTVPLTNIAWGNSWVANATLEKSCYVRNDGNTVIYIGWEATGFPYLDSGTGFYYDGSTPFTLNTSNFYYQQKVGGSQWRSGLVYNSVSNLKTLEKGAVLNSTLKLSTGYNPAGGASISFTVIYTAYDTVSG